MILGKRTPLINLVRSGGITRGLSQLTKTTMIDHFYSSSRCRKCHHHNDNICAAVSYRSVLCDEGHIICHWAWVRFHTGVRGNGQLSSIRISPAGNCLLLGYLYTTYIPTNNIVLKCIPKVFLCMCYVGKVLKLNTIREVMRTGYARICLQNVTKYQFNFIGIQHHYLNPFAGAAD